MTVAQWLWVVGFWGAGFLVGYGIALRNHVKARRKHQLQIDLYRERLQDAYEPDWSK